MYIMVPMAMIWYGMVWHSQFASTINSLIDNSESKGLKFFSHLVIVTLWCCSNAFTRKYNHFGMTRTQQETTELFMKTLN